MNIQDELNKIKSKQAGYTRTRANKIREQLDQISNEELVYWSDSLFHSNFESPKEHIEKCAKDYEDDVVPF